MEPQTDMTEVRKEGLSLCHSHGIRTFGAASMEHAKVRRLRHRTTVDGEDIAPAPLRRWTVPVFDHKILQS